MIFLRDFCGLNTLLKTPVMFQKVIQFVINVQFSFIRYIIS